MKTAFFDIDTQFDFVLPTGALYVAGAERILPAVSRLNRYAAEHGMPLVSTMDAHTENDVEFRSWPPHCIAGTLGQKKPDSTLLGKRVVVANAEGDFEIGDAGQILVEKQTVNVFETRTIGKLLEKLAAERFVVYGVVTEVCVLHAVRGLLKTGLPVLVVTDAVKQLTDDGSRGALEEAVAGGGSLVTTAEVLGC